MRFLGLRGLVAVLVERRAYCSPPRGARKVVLTAGVVVAVGLSGFAQTATGTELVLPPGEIAKVTQVKFGGCNSLSYGYQLDEGPGTELASFPGGCGEAPGPNATIGPYPVGHVLRFYLNDNTCGFTFYSDGSGGSGEHGKVNGSNPYLVLLRDGGGFCEYPPGQPIPPSSGGNLEATVTVEPGPTAPPEFGRCKKVGGKAGKFSNGVCTVNVPGSAKEREFEWYPGPGPKNKYTATGGAGTFFETHEGYSGDCTSVKGNGEYLTGSDNKHLTARFEWAGCKVISAPDPKINGASCQSAGRGLGEVVSNPLEGEVGWENKAKHRTALVLGPTVAYEGVFAEWKCGPYTFVTTTHGRGLLVKIKNNAMKLAEPLKFLQTKGVQKPDKWHVGEAGEEFSYLETNLPVNFGQVGTSFEAKVTNEERIELNTAA
jgi:hypothetical protein